MTLIELIRFYLQRERGRGMSLNTLGIDRRWLEHFNAFCAGEGVSIAADVTSAHVAAYRRQLLWQPGPAGHLYTPFTVDLALRTVRSFFRWATKRSYLLVDPTADLVLARPPKPVHTKILSVEEVELVLDAPDPDTPLGMRDRAVLETFYGTGVRLAECNDLDVNDLDLEARTVSVNCGKGGKARVLPLGATLVESLERYLSEARPTLVHRPTEPALFISFLGCRIGRASLQDIVVRASRRALGFRIGPHALRHACATHLLQNGADLSSIGELLGHTNPKSTYLYTHLCPQELFEEHQRTHPRAGRGDEEEASAEDNVTEDGDDAPPSSP